MQSVELTTGWHDIRVRQPKRGDTVYVVRKAWFSDDYYIGTAKWDGRRFSAGCAYPTVTYWHEIQQGG